LVKEGIDLRAQLSAANVSASTTAQRIHWLLEQVPRYQESRAAKAGLPGKFIIDPSPRQMNTQRAIETLTNAQVQPVFSQQPVNMQPPIPVDQQTFNQQPMSASQLAEIPQSFTLQRCDTIPKDIAGQSKVAECNAVPMPEFVPVPVAASKKTKVAVDQTWWQDYVLTMVFHGPGVSRGVINGKFVNVGSGLSNGVSVYRISESSVFLRKAKTLFELKLNKYGNDGALTPMTTK
jgi:hypothetical protein